MPATYENIATTTLSSNQATVTFSGISQNFTDLILVGQLTANNADSSILLRVGNGSVDTGTNYSETQVYGNGTSAVSARESNVSQPTIAYTDNSTTNLNTNLMIHFMNYSNTTTNKTILTRNNAPSRLTLASVTLWRSTSAINVITLYLNSTWQYLSGSTFTLYGIKAA